MEGLHETTEGAGLTVGGIYLNGEVHGGVTIPSTRGWLDSDGHRANLLNPRFRDHGVALRTGTLSGNAGAAVWVHQLGYHC